MYRCGAQFRWIYKDSPYIPFLYGSILFLAAYEKNWPKRKIIIKKEIEGTEKEKGKKSREKKHYMHYSHDFNTISFYWSLLFFDGVDMIKCFVPIAFTLEWEILWFMAYEMVNIYFSYKYDISFVIFILSYNIMWYILWVRDNIYYRFRIALLRQLKWQTIHSKKIFLKIC